MKKKLHCLLILLLLVTADRLWAQPPAGVPFQAIAKDNLLNPAKNRTVYIQCAITHKKAVGGTLMYEEAHKVQTNSDGVFDIIIGQGTRGAGSRVTSLSLMDWANGPYFLTLKVAVAPTLNDPTWLPGNNYLEFGTIQIYSTFYALYAANASVTNVNTNIKAGPPNTFLTTDSLGNVNWTTPQAAQVNVTQVFERPFQPSTTTGQSVRIGANTTAVAVIYVPGVRPGDPVIAFAQGDYINWMVYNAWVRNPDTVAVRFGNLQNTSISIQGSDYKIVIFK